MVISGIVIIILSVWRYNQVFWQIERADYRPSRFLVWLTAGLTILLGILSIPFLFWRHPSNPKTSASPIGQVDYPLRKLGFILLNR